MQKYRGFFPTLIVCVCVFACAEMADKQEGKGGQSRKSLLLLGIELQKDL